MRNKAIFTSVVLSVLLIITLLPPESKIYPDCYFHSLTGLNCPTCGLGRSLYAMSHLRINDAFKFHLFGPFIYLFLLSTLIKYGFKIVTRRELQIKMDKGLRKISTITVFCIWIGFWIIRNLVLLY